MGVTKKRLVHFPLDPLTAPLQHSGIFHKGGDANGLNSWSFFVLILLKPPGRRISVTGRSRGIHFISEQRLCQEKSAMSGNCFMGMILGVAARLRVAGLFCATPPFASQCWLRIGKCSRRWYPLEKGAAAH